MVLIQFVRCAEDARRKEGFSSLGLEKASVRRGVPKYERNLNITIVLIQFLRCAEDERLKEGFSGLGLERPSLRRAVSRILKKY